MKRPDPAPDPHEDLVADTAAKVRQLKLQLPLLEDLHDSRQQRRNYIPPETRRIIGEQYARDVRGRREGAIATGYVADFVGNSPAPGNMSAWGLSAEVSITLRHLISRCLKHHAAQGVRRREVDPQLVRLKLATPGARSGLDVVLGAEPDWSGYLSAFDTAGYLYELLWTVDATGIVRHVDSEVTYLLAQVTTYLDGEERMDLRGVECPHCDNPTLVLYIESQAVRCERPRGRDGTRPRCRCAYAQCPCHHDDAFVHHWSSQRPNGARDSLQTLQTQLQAAKRLKAKETS